jgi:sulfate transport system substrate-binding protein
MRWEAWAPVALNLIAAALALGLFVATVKGCQMQAEGDETPKRHTIVVYGFSVGEEVMADDLLPAFQAYWQERTGQEVSFQGVFTGSEEIVSAISDSAAADVAILSNEQHAVWLRINGWVETDWHTLPHEGIVSRSPIAIVVRPGNPFGIEDWADLARLGVEVVHPHPRTSGGAQWALLAEYGSALLDETDSSKDEAREQLRTIWANVVATPASSRAALREFMFGTGDALITYEQDALLARARGAALEVVIPRSTVMSEHVVVIVDRNVKPWEREVVEAFVAFLWSEEAQNAFTRYYFRAVTDEALNQAVPEFHEIERPFTVLDLGGWGQAYPEIVYEAWDEQILKSLN